MKKIILFTLIITLFGCKSFDDKKIEEYGISKGIDNIRHNVEKKKLDIFEGYILSNRLLSKINDEKERQKTEDYINQLKKEMESNLRTNNDDKKYEDSLRYALSLKAIGVEPMIGLKDIYENMLLQSEASSDIFTQNSIKYELADRNILSIDKVYKLLKYLAEKKSRGEFLYYLDKYSKSYGELLSKYPDLSKNKIEMLNLNELNFEKMLNSLVMVILDKGMDIKGGMGFLDKSIGTGFFVDQNGYILTNHHVIADHVNPKYDGYSKVYITTKDDPDTEIPATVIGYDKVFDIALLKIAKTDTPPLILGRSLDVNLGDKIYAIGNPIGIKNTVTSGIISNKDIDFFQLGRAFQIDAAVNPGNSGGPLVDDKGQVIAIVFAGVPQYQGISFAIPFRWVMKSIPNLYKGGEVKRCWIGAGIYNEGGKVKVYYLMPNGEAERAGIQIGDFIKKIDGVEVSSVEEAQEQLSWKRYPMLIEIEVEREGVLLKKIVRLSERPFLPIETLFQNDIQRKIITLVYGVELDYYAKSIFTKKYKVRKVYKGMAGAQAGIPEGEPITIYDLKYIEKDKMIVMTASYKNKEVGIIERIVTIPAYAEINSLL